MNTPSLQELRRQNARRHTQTPLWRRLLLPAAIVGVVTLLFLWLALPHLVRGPIERRLSAELHRPVSIERLRFNPLALSVAVEKLRITDPDGQPLVAWENVYANLNFFPLLRGTISFSELTLSRFQGHLRVSPEGKLNIADLLASRPPAAGETPPHAAPKRPLRLHLARLQIIDSALNYTDASTSTPFQTKIGPTNLILTDLHTTDDRLAPGMFSATTEAGESFVWRGQLSLAPLHSKGEVTLTKISLPKYHPYHAHLHQLALADGQLDLALNYEFSLENSLPVLRLAPSSAQLRNLKLTPARPSLVPDASSLSPQPAPPLVDLAQIDLRITSAVLPLAPNPALAPSLDLESLHLAGGQLKLTRSTSGLDLLQLISPANQLPTTNSQLQTPASPLPAANVRLRTFTVRQLGLSLTDTTPARPATHTINALNLDLQNLNLADLATPLPFILETQLPASGLVRAQGTVSLQPLSAELALEISQLPLAPFSPYVETSAPLRLTAGTFHARANAKLALAPDTPPQLSAQAEFSLADLAASDLQHPDELLRLARLEIKGLDYTSEPARLSIASAELRAPVVNYTLYPSPAADSAPSAPSATAPSVLKPDSSSRPPLFIALDQVLLADAAFTFTDRTLSPIPQLALENFSGTIKGLSSVEVARADVALRGQVANSAELLVTGTINPLAPEAFTDLKINLAPTNLASLSPYVSKYAGYALAQGNASLSQVIRLENRRLDTKNVLTLSPFTLGPRTPGPDATKLPVPFALALLRDTQGRIIIDLPVSGRLDDPSFKVSKVVIRVITNLLTKAVTSPFTLLASAFGGKSASKPEDLAQQTFTFGVAQLNEYTTRHLDTLARALRDRPGLTLEITGGYDPLNDAPALRELELERRLQATYKEEFLRLNRDQTELPANFTPTPEQTQRILAQYYREAYLPEEARVTALVDQVTQGNAARTTAKADTPAASSGPALTSSGPKRRWFIFRLFGSGNKTSAAPAGPAVLPPDPAQLAAALTPLPPPNEVRARVLEAIPADTADLEALAQARAQAVQTYLVTNGQVEPARVPIAPKIATKGPRANLELK